MNYILYDISNEGTPGFAPEVIQIFFKDGY